MTDLAPACRYRFRVRRLNGDHPASAWSEVFVLERRTRPTPRTASTLTTSPGGPRRGRLPVVYRGVHNGRHRGEAAQVPTPQRGAVGKFSVEVAILSRVRHRNVAFVGAVTEQPNCASS